MTIILYYILFIFKKKKKTIVLRHFSIKLRYFDKSVLLYYYVLKEENTFENQIFLSKRKPSDSPQNIYLNILEKKLLFGVRFF